MNLPIGNQFDPKLNNGVALPPTRLDPGMEHKYHDRNARGINQHFAFCDGIVVIFKREPASCG